MIIIKKYQKDEWSNIIKRKLPATLTPLTICLVKNFIVFFFLVDTELLAVG